MQDKVTTPEEYIHQVSEERQDGLRKLQHSIKTNLPKGFEEGMQYGMIGYYVPHSIYPKGYHCKVSEPLPFMSFASRRIPSIYITWGCMPKRNYTIGLLRNFRSTPKVNSIWERAVFVLKM